MDLKEICLPIQREMVRLDEVIQENLTSKVSFVQNVVHYVIQNGGKRLRPILTILGAKLSGYSGEASIQLGAAIEFMHTASLLHDDVLDNATLRRGRATTNKKWGNLVSILVGDFFYCRAMDMLVRHGDMKVLRVITDAVTTTTEGEILEITKSNDVNIRLEDYLQIINNKTAALMGACSQTGAILGGLSEEFELALRDFGLYLGMAFQLMDDVLDYTAKEEEFGKSNGIDLKEGKLTLPLITALQRSTPAETQMIKNALMTEEMDAARFKEVLRLIHHYDGIKETNKLAKSYALRARERLEIFRPSLEKDTLQTIADYVLNRSN